MRHNAGQVSDDQSNDSNSDNMITDTHGNRVINGGGVTCSHGVPCRGARSLRALVVGRRESWPGGEV